MIRLESFFKIRITDTTDIYNKFTNLIAVYFSIVSFQLLSVYFYFIFYVKIEKINYKKLGDLSGIVGGVWEATREVVWVCDFVCDFVCEATCEATR